MCIVLRARRAVAMLEVRASDLPPGNAHGNSLAKKGCVGIHVRPADSVADADQPLQEVVAKCLAAIEAWRRLLRGFRSEEHTSELQSLMRISYAVFCLKKKN